MTTEETLSERVARLRIERGMTQAELAIRCGVTKQSISKFEQSRDRDMYVSTMLRMIDALDVSLTEFIYGEDLESECIR